MKCPSLGTHLGVEGVAKGVTKQIERHDRDDDGDAGDDAVEGRRLDVGLRSRDHGAPACRRGLYA